MASDSEYSDQQQVFVYEWMTGGGLLHSALDTPSELLVAEGRAMVVCAALDLARIRGIKVVTMWDARQELHPGVKRIAQLVDSAEDEQACFDRLATQSQWALVIAPETGGLLFDRCRRVKQLGGKLLGGSLETIALAANKHLTAEYLRRRQVQTPFGVEIAPGERLPRDFSLPAVLKPIDGAGSVGVRLLSTVGELVSQPPLEQAMRLEEYRPGDPISVSVLCGPGRHYPLPACRQHLSAGRKFRYHGGSFPLPPAQATRAKLLATRTIEALPFPFGWIGVDMVLGHHHDGRDDYVIEVNPRLTTSYSGLWYDANCNIAAAMLAVAEGRRPRLSFYNEAWEFDASGKGWAQAKT